MKRRAILLTLFGLLLAGCGGGGGGGNGAPAPDVNVTVLPTEAAVALRDTILLTANVNGAEDRTVTWTASAGRLLPAGPNQTRFDPPDAAGDYTVTAISVARPSARATARIRVAGASETIVTGTFAASFGGTLVGVSGLRVRFLDGRGNRLATATTGLQGRLSAAVPAGARRFQIDPDTLPKNSAGRPTVYSTFGYNGKVYDGNIAGCDAPLPTLVPGGTVPLSGQVRFYAAGGPPPPPPTGCG